MSPKSSPIEVEEVASVEVSLIPDHITGELVKETPKELVRQEVARAMTFEYQIPPECMERDFKVKMEGKTKRIDIAVFTSDAEHTISNLVRAIVVRPEPKAAGRRAVIKIRDFQQAGEDLEDLKGIMSGAKACEWGLWTNGLEQFFLHKEQRRFEDRFNPRGDWPLADGTMATPDMQTDSSLRRGDEAALKRAFRRCHNFIHGNEGMPKDAAFWQFLFLIFSKMYDERNNRGHRQFYAGADEPFKEEGRMAIEARIRALFTAVRKDDRYRNVFRESDDITLSRRALSYMVAELQRYDFSHSDVDAKGAAYQEIVGNNLRGDRGQYFTPRRVVDLAIRILDPRPTDKILDPACGTGGFLVAAIAHQFARFKAERKRALSDVTLEEINDRLRDYVRDCVFGADFDPFLVRSSMMNMMMAANTEGNVYHMDSLAYPLGHQPGVELAKRRIPLGSIDILMTNPPFGSDIPITEPMILDNNPLARRWRKNDSGIWEEQIENHKAVAPEVLFISQAVNWLKEGGRMAIVLPNGILGNPGDEPIRRWILKHCWILACIEIPIEAFIAEANVGILTSLLILKKKTDEVQTAEAMGHATEYPIFMAIAEKAGVDRRGNTIYKHNPDGTEIIIRKEIQESVILRGEKIVRTRTIAKPEIADDFPDIALAYEKFRSENPEPGL